MYFEKTHNTRRMYPRFVHFKISTNRLKHHDIGQASTLQQYSMVDLKKCLIFRRCWTAPNNGKNLENSKTCRSHTLKMTRSSRSKIGPDTSAKVSYHKVETYTTSHCVLVQTYHNCAEHTVSISTMKHFCFIGQFQKQITYLIMQSQCISTLYYLIKI